MPKISVIVPVYNGEAHIAHCIQSLQKQTLNDIEIICVNDGSTDSTEDIIKQYQVDDPRIVYIFQKNRGAGVARNNGIKNATGEFIGFVDSDDEYADETVLEVLYNAAIEQNVLICGGSWLFGESDNYPDNKRVFTENKLYLYRDYQFDFGFQRFIYKRELFEKIEFPEYRVYEDPVFLTNIMDLAKSFYALHNSVYKFSGTHSDNLNCVKTVDYIKGLTENLKFSAAKGYEKLHRINFERLISTASYFVEKNLDKTNEIRLYYALMDARGSVDIGLLQEAGIEIDSQIKIPALDYIWNTSQRYLTSFTYKAKRKLKGTRR